MRLFIFLLNYKKPSSIICILFSSVFLVHFKDFFINENGLGNRLYLQNFVLVRVCVANCNFYELLWLLFLINLESFEAY